MKKIILVVTGLLMCVSSFADGKKSTKFVRPYGMAGCGLGSQMMGKDGSQVFASTTNGSTANQLFGITSGTSNCVDNENDDVAQRMDRFVGGNTVAVANDIARGNGETLAGLSQLMGCAGNSDLGVTLQRNFKEIFPTHKVTPNEVTDSIISVVKSNQALSQACKHII